MDAITGAIQRKRGIDMERLTRTSDFGEAAFTFDLYINCRPSEWKKILNVATRLKEYEDLEEQGRLIKLPCEDVYFIVDANNPKYALVMRTSVRELTICEIEKIDKKGCKYFSTKEKAESKLKELRGGENEE